MAFLANRILWRKFAYNAKICVLGKIGKYFILLSAEMFTQHAVFNYDVCILFDALVSFEGNDFVLVVLGHCSTCR